MRIYIVSILFLIFCIVNAAEIKYQIWGIGKNYYAFSVDTATHALISSNCLDTKNICKALMAKKNPQKITFTESQLSGGKNPSSLLCSLGHNGNVVILKDKNDNENSFCVFSDHSMISANDLDR
jgi:hypothetical protein